jgi:hypothetical protein
MLFPELLPIPFFTGEIKNPATIPAKNDNAPICNTSLFFIVFSLN